MPHFDAATYRRIGEQVDSIQNSEPNLLHKDLLDLEFSSNALRRLASQNIDTDLLQTLELELFKLNDQSLAWILSAKKDSIGYGRLTFNDESQLWQTHAAYIAYQGLGLAPAVIRTLRYWLGPLHSGISLSPGAVKAWQRAGGKIAYTPQGKRYYMLD